MTVVKGGFKWIIKTTHKFISNPKFYKLAFNGMISTLIAKNPADFLYYYCAEVYKNWGDSLNHTLIPLLSCKKTIYTGNIFPSRGRYNSIIYNKIKAEKLPVYSVIGSGLGRNFYENDVIWGTGFWHEDSVMSGKPKNICAVRGPLSAEKLEEQIGYSTTIYGDPAALYSLYYKPIIQKKYRLGIIPHYKDYNYFKKYYSKDENTIIINIRSNINSFIDILLSCECIASSSLHGLIMSDAYHIPTVWLQRISSTEDYFKYKDYYESIRYSKENVAITNDLNSDALISMAELSPHNINMKKLLNACPFYNREKSPIQIK